MDLVQKITQTIEPSLDAMGYAIVQIRMADGMRRKTLTIMAERKDDQNMGFDDCTEISRMVGALLEVEDPISTAYDLEVCSPGLDRPLTKLADYTKYKGQEAKLETLIPQGYENRKRFRGTIVGSKDNKIELKMPEGDVVEIEFTNIRSAKLVSAFNVPAAKKEKPGKKKKNYA